MTTTAASGDAFVKHARESFSCGDLGGEIPKGHIGPVLLSGTGRTVWWTGRVAIGLRYEHPGCRQQVGQSAHWIQSALLNGR